MGSAARGIAQSASFQRQFTPAGGQPVPMQKALDRSFGEALNVLSYRAGSDTGIAAAFNRAITEANQGGGATVLIPKIPGLTYNLEAEVVPKSNVGILGVGKPLINLFPGTSGFVSEGFRDMTMTGLAGGIENAFIEGINLYGNWTPTFAAALTTPQYGIAYYGREIRIEKITMKRLRGHGLWSEYADQAHGSSPWDSRLRDITMVSIGEYGWYNNADDLHFNGINIRDASRAVDGGFDGVNLAGGCRGENINVWTGGNTPGLTRYSLNFSGGGGSEIYAANIEAGSLGTIRFATERVKFNGRAHSGAGPSCILLLGNKNTLDISTYKGSRSDAIVPIIVGDASQKPIHNDVSLNISGYLQPSDTSNSGGTNRFKFTGENAYNGFPVTGLNATDDVDILVSGAFPYSMKKPNLSTKTPTGTTSGSAALITAATTKISVAGITAGVRLPSSPGGGDERWICNSDTVPHNVYPHSGGKFAGSTLNTPVSLPAGAVWLFKNTAFDWAVIKSA